MKLFLFHHERMVVMADSIEAAILQFMGQFPLPENATKPQLFSISQLTEIAPYVYQLPEIKNAK